MARRNVTVKDLRREIDKVNGYLAEGKFSFRLREAGRNGYQAVDAYFVHPDGTPHEDGAVRNVCCGTSRECIDAIWEDYNNKYMRARRDGLVK